VQGGGGLFRINRSNRTSILWQPNEVDYYGHTGSLDLLSPLNEGILVLYDSKELRGVRVDGALAFRIPVDAADANGRAPISAAQDSEGTVWIADGNGPKGMVYAYAPRTQRFESVPGEFAQAVVFADPGRRVYANTRDGLFALGSVPRFDRRLVHAPIPAPAPAPEQYGTDCPTLRGIQAVGPDGSLWASTCTQVIHVHRDGSIHVIRLAPPITSMKGLPSAIQLIMARDGAVWISWRKLIRITGDDEVQVIGIPRNGVWNRSLSFGPDNTGWAVSLVFDGGNDSVVHFSISPSSQAHARNRPSEGSAIITEKAKPLSSAAARAPEHLPETTIPKDLGIRGGMLVFAPFLGPAWSCHTNAAPVPGFPPYPRRFSMTFIPLPQGNYLRRHMFARTFSVTTLYDFSVIQRAFRAYTNEGRGGDFVGGGEQLSSDDGLMFSGINSDQSGQTFNVTEKYIWHSPKRFTIYFTFLNEKLHAGNIVCTRNYV
jgi:hypothetical protein